jgi:chromosome segregation ATPase
MKTNHETATKAAQLEAASAQTKLHAAERKGAKTKAALRAAKAAYKHAKKSLKLARKKAKSARKEIAGCRDVAADAAGKLRKLEKKATAERPPATRAARLIRTKTKSLPPVPAIVPPVSPMAAHAGAAD